VAALLVAAGMLAAGAAAPSGGAAKGKAKCGKVASKKAKSRQAAKRKCRRKQVSKPAPGTPKPPAPAVENRSLDGSGNNQANPSWGWAGTNYVRVAGADYADGIAAMSSGPPTRRVSNRVFNDVGQNLFSENGISQWGWAWGQFMDHDFGLRDETPAESATIAFSASDPLERFTNDFGSISFFRTPAAPGTGVTSTREQVNTISSYIDASNVYGSDSSRLDWLRSGSADGDPADNAASLLLPGGYLPRKTARGDASSAPAMDLMGALTGTPDRAAVAGDVRANENIALTSIHTLFAREHNRIVASLPASLTEEQKFQIARRVVGAEAQYVTYQEFLPALGIHLPAYQGYRPGVNATLGNEFAAVGYRAHSMIHGEFEVDAEAGDYSPAQLDAFEAAGIEVTETAGEVALGIPLNAAFGNPDLLEAVGEGHLLASLGRERQYKNDEQIDDSLRSVLFQVPKPGAADPAACGLPAANPDCFSGVVDLGAIDVERARDHGIPSYNDLRRAYGLSPRTSFRQITGEPSESFPSGLGIDDPASLDFVELRDADGNVLAPGSEEAAEEAVRGRRRTPLAARLKALYGDVEDVDGFVGMVSEPHVPGTEFGPLQLAIWQRQFAALRDGDRFFYLNDPELQRIRTAYGIDYRKTLSRLIGLNAGVHVAPNVFVTPAPGQAGS
jgi:hypothetical protein